MFFRFTDPTNGSTEIVEKDVEHSTEKLKYPRAIPFIISNEFCERFNFYGMKAILVLYLTRKLLYDDDDATVLYHTFNVLVYFFCIFGAINKSRFPGAFNGVRWCSVLFDGFVDSAWLLLLWIALCIALRATWLNAFHFFVSIGNMALDLQCAEFIQSVAIRITVRWFPVRIGAGHQNIWRVALYLLRRGPLFVLQRYLAM